MTWREVIIAEADRLVGEYPEIAAGSVLRCFARALRVARNQGRPPEEAVPAAAEAARHTLRLRRMSVAVQDQAVTALGK